MKKFTLNVLLVLFLMISFQAVAVNSIIPISEEKTNTQVLVSNQDGMDLKFHFGDIGYFDVKTPQGIFTEIIMADAYSTNRVGEPILPAQKKLIAIPFGAEVSLSIDSYTTSTINLSDKGIKYELMPLQYDVPKDLDPSEVPFQYNKQAYAAKSYNQTEIATIEVLGVMRGVRMARITVEPTRYNPSTNQLEIYNDIKISVSYKNADWGLTNQTFQSTYSPFFEVAYRQLLNVDNVYDDHPDLLTFPVNMLIVADPMFTTALQPFLEWKTLMGYELTVGYTDVIGSTVGDIETWVHNEYNTGLANGNAPDFVIFVGDVQQVPASATGSSSGKKTDLYYASVDGDMFPEMYYGRLSAQTVPQLEAQLNKIIYYEKYEFDNPAYLDDVTLIAGADGSGNPNYGQPTITYGTDNYFNAQHGYNNMNVYLDSPYTGCYDDERIRVSFINYTAHCSQTSWGDPNLSISDVYAFDNPNEYPIAIGNCCLAADFGYGECIGEAWVRAENKGAAGYIGSSPSSYWKADMYWSVGAYPMTNNNGGGYVPTFAETTMGAYDGSWGETYYCLHAIAFVGNLAVTEVNLQSWLNDASSIYYWQAYNTLGDPSMMPYNTQGTANTVTHMDIVPIGATQYEVAAEPGSYVAITKDGVIHGTGYVDNTGVVMVDLFPITESGDVNIVVTKSQYIPYMTIVPAAALAGPYLTINDFVFDNGTTAANYGTSVIMDITISNLGTDPSSNVTVTAINTDTYCTLTSAATINIGNIAAGEVITITEAFYFDIADNAPDMHTVNLEFDIEGTSKEIWQSSVNFEIYAPSPAFGTYTIDDTVGNNNGRIDPGETVDITIQTLNNGHAATIEGEMLVSTSSPSLTINTPSLVVAVIDAEGMQEVTMNVTADVDIQIGTLVEIDLDYTAGNYTASHLIQETIGLILEDFETGDFTQFDWQFNNYPWTIVSGDQAYEGNYAARSASISDNQNSAMELEYSVEADGEISFYYKVSSESSYDYLKFYINDVEQDEWSGEVAWTEATYNVTPGDYTFKWEYDKDVSVSTGDDCGWVDYIILPPAISEATCSAGDDAEICYTETEYQLNATASNCESTEWTTAGDGSFSDIASLTAIYTPGDNDILNGFAQLTLTAYATPPGTNVSDDMILTIVGETTVGAGNDTTTCENEVHTLSGVANNFESVLWTTTGDGTFDDASLLDASYTLGVNDILFGSVDLILTAYAAAPCLGDTLDMMTLSVNYNPEQPQLPLGPVSVDLNNTLVSEYTTTHLDNTTSYTWYLDPEEAGTITGNDTIGTVNWDILFLGEASVKVAGVNDCGSSEFSDPLLITVINSVGVVDIQEDISVNIVPNPSSGKFIVAVASSHHSIFDISIVNQLGKVIIESNEIDFSNISEKSFEIDNVPAGIYYVIVQNNDSRIVKKLLIKNN